ncbi:hypothetical protein QJS10_CPB14g00393 [Acorus calamus]|uniref:Pentatricopeptide repeat-containing protein n=1 Tax=Acorus calamus TaxID=4465 RepID=A0AAV9DBF5_ACOCL|nr:hypothetical protein QJS10_CPB14g00393 [Acorus calamus]
MTGRGITPNLAIYRDLIYGFCGLRKSTEGERLMKEMVECDLMPDNEISMALINGYCEEGNFDEAESLLDYFAK